MNERKQDTVFTPGIVTDSWSNNIIFIGSILDRIWTRICIISFSVIVAYPTWKVWERNRSILRLRKTIDSIPQRYRQTGCILVHLLTILVTGSYLTLALFSKQNAENYLWWYILVVLLLNIVGMLFSRGRING